jgi:ABC-type branched-subunit amino acid transport system ATPase component
VTSLLRVENLTAGYGRLDILHGVSIDVGVGEIVALIGPNGAGKSTVLKTVVAFLRPRARRVSFDGQDITGLVPISCSSADWPTCRRAGSPFPR